MKGSLTNLNVEIELQPGEQLTLPEPLRKAISPGRWLITIQPVSTEPSPSPIGNHQAFLNSYAAEDEGLYDHYPAR
jgi:hypothetical protein